MSTPVVKPDIALVGNQEKNARITFHTLLTPTVLSGQSIWTVAHFHMSLLLSLQHIVFEIIMMLKY